ncbi:hypothetical protein Ancab_040387 [Ancistrocladus abbreviatus]
MEQEKGILKFITLVQFKEDVSHAEIEDLIKGYASLVNLVPSLKDFTWGENTSIDNGVNRENTYIFELIFEDSNSFNEYITNPDHLAFGNIFRPKVKQFQAIDYIPTKVLN